MLELPTRCWKVKRSEKLHICANMDKSEKILENLSDTNGDIANPCVQLLKKVGHILLSMEYEVGSSWKCSSRKCVSMSKVEQIQLICQKLHDEEGTQEKAILSVFHTDWIYRNF